VCGVGYTFPLILSALFGELPLKVHCSTESDRICICICICIMLLLLTFARRSIIIIINCWPESYLLEFLSPAAICIMEKFPFLSEVDTLLWQLCWMFNPIGFGTLEIIVHNNNGKGSYMMYKEKFIKLRILYLKYISIWYDMFSLLFLWFYCKCI